MKNQFLSSRNVSSHVLVCFAGFAASSFVYSPAKLNRPKVAMTNTSNVAINQKFEAADSNPKSSNSPCENDALSPLNFDFGLVESTETSVWWNNGSFVLRYKSEDENTLEIVMVGPDDGPEEDPPGHVLWGINPKDCKDYFELKHDDILKFISRRLKTQTNITQEEANYLSALLVYTHKLVRLKRWGIGSRHFQDGEWYKLFERPDKASFGSYPKGDKDAPSDDDPKVR